MINLSTNALQIFSSLYSKDGETVDETFKRVAGKFATNNKEFELAYELQKQNIWRPNTPVYFNSNINSNKFLASGCWVVPLEDSMNGIYDVADIARKIFSNGAGIGIPLGNLREKDAPIFGEVKSRAMEHCFVHTDWEGYTERHEFENGICKWCNKSEVPEGKSSGPIVFMKLFDAVAATTKSGGRARRAAILCSMPIWHPDILEFIRCKELDGTLSNMNISVAITDKFMQCLKDKTPFSLHTPYDGGLIKNEDSVLLWNSIAEMAHRTGDPGIIFIDNVNRFNPLKKKILIETTNPCGEQPLPPFGACALSMINVAQFVNTDNTYDFDGLFKTSYDVCGLMNNLLDIMDFPDERFKEQSLKYRPVGIGPAGLADAMYMLGLRYNGKDGRDFAAEIMRVMTHGCIRKSIELAKKDGTFFDYETFKDDVEEIVQSLITPDVDDDEVAITMDLLKEYGIRNFQHTTCMPTGTTAISCDCSYGIEPSFGLVFEKNLITGTKMKFVNPIFEGRFKKESWYTDDLIDRIYANGGSLKNVRGVPKEVKEVFVVAHDIRPKDRIDIQASIQRHCSSAISSTVNLPSTTTAEEIAELYEYAYNKGLKGVTVYRDGCKKNQPVSFKKDDSIVSTFFRPTKLPAMKHCVEMYDGKFYIDVVEYQGKVVEIWLQSGDSGQEMHGILQALGKSLSTGLQHGVPLSAYVKQFKDIKGEMSVWVRFEDADKKPVQVFSKPNALARLLERYYLHSKMPEGAFVHETCPKCHESSLLMVEGCMTCASCGFSKCS